MSFLANSLKEAAKKAFDHPHCPDFLICFIWSHSKGHQSPPPPVVKWRIVKEYAMRYNLRHFVETGTCRGDMVYALRKRMDRIYSIELSYEYYLKAVDRFKKYDHIVIIAGDSCQELPKLLPALHEPCIFWLDAHYSGKSTARGENDTPIKIELQSILSTRNHGDVILIDDARDFVGQNDYPTLDDVRRMVLDKHPGWHFEVSEDIIRIHPTQKAKKSKNLKWWWMHRVLPRPVLLKQRWLSDDRCYVTCPGNQDGLGAQLQARLSGMLFAHCQGLTYVHSPMTALDFTPANEPHWPAKWERFLGLGAGELNACEVARDLGEPRRVDNPTQVRMIRNSFWSLPNCHAYADLYPDRYLRLSRRFAERYHAAPKDNCISYHTPGVVNIAVHLRRGNDLAHKMQLMSRIDDTTVLLQTIVGTLHHIGMRYVIRVFSQGAEEDFRELRQFGVELHLDEDLFSTFHSLVCADVLVMAKSSFSYSAALLSRGLIIYKPMHHAPLPNWMKAKIDGSLSRSRLLRRLRAHLDSRPVQGLLP